MKVTVRGLRILAGLPQIELAGECGVSPRTVGRWEADEHNVPFGVLLYLSERISPARIIVDNGDLRLID